MTTYVKSGVIYHAIDEVSEVVEGIAKKSAVATTAIAAGVAVAAAAFVKLTTEAARMGSEVFEAADRVGTSAEFISQMGFAAKQAGADMGTIERAIQSLSKNVLSGSAAFERYGVTLRDENGNLKNTERLFRDAAQRVSEFTNPVEQAAAAQDIFGKAGKDLLPILRGGAAAIDEFAARADALGVTVDTTTAIIADEFSDRLGEMEGALAGLTRELGSVFLPVFTEVFVTSGESVGALTKLLQDNRDELQRLAREGTADLVRGFADLVRTTGDVVENAKLVYEWSKALNPLFGIQATIVETLVQNYDKLGAAASTVYSWSKALNPVFGLQATVLEKLGGFVVSSSDSTKTQGSAFEQAASKIDQYAAAIEAAGFTMERFAAERAREQEKQLTSVSPLLTVKELEDAQKRQEAAAKERIAAAKQRAAEEKKLDERRTEALGVLNEAVNYNNQLGVFREELTNKIAFGTAEEIDATLKAVAAYNELNVALRGNQELTREQIEAKYEAASAEIQAQAQRDEAFELSVAKLDERREKALENQQAFAEATKRSHETMISSSIGAAQSFAEIGIAAAQGALTGEEAAKRFASVVITSTGEIISAIVSQNIARRTAAVGEVLATGAVTAANAGESAGKVAGPFALGVVPAVIGAMTAIFAALATSFAKGGVVGGGTPGRDSVPAMLMPKERVLTVSQNQAFERLMGIGGPTHSGPGFAEGGVVAAPIGRNGPNQSITIVLPQLVPERDANFRRTMGKTVKPELERLTRDGAAGDPRSFGPRG